MAVERLVLRALRKDDFLDLTFELVNVHAEGVPPRLVRSVAGEPALLIVHFPAQHVAEEAFEQNEANTLSPGPAPVRGMLAGPSRLVFKLPDEQGDWPLTLETLMDWRTYAPVLAPNALPPGATVGPGPAQPTPEQSALELPTGVLLSPDQSGGWSHALGPVERNGRTELWHTRLGMRDQDGKLREDRARFVRAIWSTNPAIRFRNSLTPADRTDIVRLSSDFSLPQRPPQYANNPTHIAFWHWRLSQAGLLPKYTPRPIGVRHLMLSSLGAWTSLESEWDYPTIIPELNGGLGYPQLALEQWQHIAAQGRDQYVKTVQKAFLCDPAHRASIVTITERQFHPMLVRTEQTPQGAVSIFGSTAFLRQYQYIEVQEPLKDYRPLARAFRSEGRELPFTRLHITTRSTPKLDSVMPDDKAFWPIVGGKPFTFQILAEDREGRTVPDDRPLLVVPLRATRSAGAWQTIVNEYNKPENLGRRTAHIDGHPVAFADTGAEDRGKTSLDTTTLVSEAQYVPPEKLKGEPGHPLFLPTMRSAQVGLPAAERLLGRPSPVEIVFDPEYLAHGFSDTQNRGEVFANLTHKLELPFSAEKGGGLIKPDTSIQALSRVLGPVANATAIKQGKFDTSMFDSARFLGGITLKDILVDGPFNLANVKAVDLAPAELEARLADPAFHLEVPMLTSRSVYAAGASTPFAVETRFLWKPVVRDNYRQGIFELKTQASTQLVVRATQLTPLDGSASRYEIDGRLQDFALNFAGAMSLAFTSFSFRAQGGKKLDISAEGMALTFEGPLRFVDTLRHILPESGFSDPPALEVSATGIRAGYTLGVPSVGVGVFSLQNLSISAGLSLPFVDQPAGVRFALSERHKPFLVSVALFGGGGFFALGLNARGIEQVEAAIEFGGNLSLNLGIASGGVYVMAGIYFCMTGTEVKLTGYLRCGGYLSVLGLISLSIEFYLGFTYRKKGENGGEAWGQASVKVCVKIAFFSVSVTLSIERRFAGAAGDPTFAELVAPEDWDEYCAAFA